MRNQNLNLQALKVAAFDWDNTLALDRAVLEDSIDEVLQANRMPKWQNIKTKRDKNLSFRDNFKVLFGQQAEELYEAYKEVYKRKVVNEIKRPQFAAETLDFLRDKGVQIVLITNKDRALLDFELPLLYESSLFAKIVCGHEAPQDKPNKAQLLFGVSGLIEDINTDNVWMIGDSPMDSLCALSAGAKAIRIGKPIWEDDMVSDNRDIVFFTDFAEFYKALRENN